MANLPMPQSRQTQLNRLKQLRLPPPHPPLVQRLRLLLHPPRPQQKRQNPTKATPLG